MISTVVISGCFLGLFTLQLILLVMFLRFGLRWAKVTDVTTRKIVTTVVAMFAVQIAFYAAFRFVASTSKTQSFLLDIIEFVVSILIPAVVIMRVFKARFFRAIQAWLPVLLPAIAMILIVIFVVRPFVCEGFVSPANSMAPTLLGNHWQGTCPECGLPNFCSPFDEWHDRSEAPRMICSKFHVHEIKDVPRQVVSGDRFLVAKFLKPQRWDLVTFQLPSNLATLFVARLVGLPGETIQIEGGAVSVNGDRVEVPDSIRGIEYLPSIPNVPFEPWGTKDRPAVLAENEYFVLGDFSERSNDSRVWTKGAEGSHPYAVPESHILGVVTHIYWPPKRWRILR